MKITSRTFCENIKSYNLYEFFSLLLHCNANFSMSPISDLINDYIIKTNENSIRVTLRRTANVVSMY